VGVRERSPGQLHLQRFLVVQFALALFGGAHYVNGEQFFALLAVAAVESSAVFFSEIWRLLYWD